MADQTGPLPTPTVVDIARTWRVLSARTALDAEAYGRVVQELRSDPRGPDAAILILAAIADLFIQLSAKETNHG